MIAVAAALTIAAKYPNVCSSAPVAVVAAAAEIVVEIAVEIVVGIAGLAVERVHTDSDAVAASRFVAVAAGWIIGAEHWHVVANFADFVTADFDAGTDSTVAADYP